MTQNEIIEAARNKFPTAKNLRVMETTVWPPRNLGVTRAELWITSGKYKTKTIFSDSLDKLAEEIEKSTINIDKEE